MRTVPKQLEIEKNLVLSYCEKVAKDIRAFQKNPSYILSDRLASDAQELCYFIEKYQVLDMMFLSDDPVSQSAEELVSRTGK